MGPAMTRFLLSLPIVLSTHAADLQVPELYRDVGAYNGIPPSILYAMALQESGRHMKGEWVAWPWTLNIQGEAHYFEGRPELFKALMAALGQGITNIDIGPLQVNWHWQFEQLGSPWLSTDPVYSTNIACQLMKAQRRAGEDWWPAVGRYHRPADSPRHRLAAQAYSDRVRQRWQAL